jgi:hypothetical protein
MKLEITKKQTHSKKIKKPLDTCFDFFDSNNKFAILYCIKKIKDINTLHCQSFLFLLGG